MEYQVRRYRIIDGKMDDFVELFEKQLVPIREAVGFTVESAWRLDDTHEFMWIVGYGGDDGFAAAEAAYYASPARDSVDPDPLTYIAEVNTSMATRLAP